MSVPAIHPSDGIDPILHVSRAVLLASVRHRAPARNHVLDKHYVLEHGQDKEMKDLTAVRLLTEHIQRLREHGHASKQRVHVRWAI